MAKHGTQVVFILGLFFYTTLAMSTALPETCISNSSTAELKQSEDKLKRGTAHSQRCSSDCQTVVVSWKYRGTTPCFFKERLLKRKWKWQYIFHLLLTISLVANEHCIPRNQKDKQFYHIIFICYKKYMPCKTLFEFLTRIKMFVNLAHGIFPKNNLGKCFSVP